MDCERTALLRFRDREPVLDGLQTHTRTHTDSRPGRSFVANCTIGSEFAVHAPTMTRNRYSFTDSWPALGEIYVLYVGFDVFNYI